MKELFFFSFSFSPSVAHMNSNNLNSIKTIVFHDSHTPELWTRGRGQTAAWLESPWLLSPPPPPVLELWMWGQEADGSPPSECTRGAWAATVTTDTAMFLMVTSLVAGMVPSLAARLFVYLFVCLFICGMSSVFLVKLMNLLWRFAVPCGSANQGSCTMWQSIKLWF